MQINFTFFKLVIKKAMTNTKKEIWEALDYLKKNTLTKESTHIDLRNSIWEGYNLEKQLRLRSLLLANKLISFKNQDTQWEFQLTADGILLNKSSLNRRGNIRFYKKESFKTTLLAIGIAFVSGATTAIITAYLSSNQSKNPTPVIYNQKIYPVDHISNALNADSISLKHK